MSWLSAGVASIAITWVGLIFLIKKWSGNRSMTFSQHAAQHKISMVYYAVMWLLILPVFYIFLVGWFRQEFNLPAGFVVIGTFTALGMLIAALVPEIRKYPRGIHRFAAFGMSSLMVPLLGFLLFSDAVSVLAKIVVFASILLMSYFVAYLMMNKGEDPNMLIIQSTHVGCFHLAILSAIFI